MKKYLYLILILLTATPSMATENNSTFFSRVLVSIGLSALVSNKAKYNFWKKRSLELHSLDEKQVLDLILNNEVREASIKAYFPNDLKGLIHKFFIDEWAIQGLNKETGTVYDPHGFDVRGIHKKTKKCLDPRGFGQNGYYKDVNPTTGEPTKYDAEGYNVDRWNKDGLHENGYRVDDNGFAQHISYASIGLYEAIKNVDIKAVRLLLKRSDIDVNLKNIHGVTALIESCSTIRNSSLSITKLLLEHDEIDVNLQCSLGTTLLRNCCIIGDKWLEIVKSLLGHANINVNVQDIDGATPLIACCEAGDKSLRIAKCLLNYENINVNLADYTGNTPLLWCCFQRKNQSLKIVKALLARKDIKVNIKNNDGYTALLWSCQMNDQPLQIVKLLLRHANIDVNLKDNDGYTPLDIIIEHILKHDGNYTYVRLWHLLVAKGAILDHHKNNYNNLNPSSFKKSDQTYISLIKQNPPRNCINNPCINILTLSIPFRESSWSYESKTGSQPSRSFS